ncbi:MAG: rhodanese-like domain-containing protein [Sandaracinus sp.]
MGLMSMFGLDRGPNREEAHRWVEKENATLLDVRTHMEFTSGHLRGANNIPVQELGQRMAEVPKNRKVVVYCRSGGRSAQAAAMLKSAGYEVLDIGPMSAW